jgi:hypothetical protein
MASKIVVSFASDMMEHIDVEGDMLQRRHAHAHATASSMVMSHLLPA